jgi:hypothetical protein
MNRVATALALSALLAVVPDGAEAVVGQARTTGDHYDRNPSVVQDGNLTYLFFARSQAACNRLAGCNPDVQEYDLWYKVSPAAARRTAPPYSSQ